MEKTTIGIRSGRVAVSLLLLTSIVGVVGASSANANVGFGHLFYNGAVVRTVVPPAAATQGLDNFYVVTNGASGQLAIASVAPGNPNYHGGQWKVFLVTFNSGVTPSLLTSQQAVLDAEAAGLVTVTANPAADFLCPIQP